MKDGLELSKNKASKELEQALDREKLLQRQLKEKSEQNNSLDTKLGSLSKDSSSLIDEMKHLKETMKLRNTEILKLQSDINTNEHTISTLQV